MRHGYLLGCQHIISLCVLLPVCASASPPILPGAQRCWPRAPAEFRGIGVEVNVTASLRVSQNEHSEDAYIHLRIERLYSKLNSSRNFIVE